MLGNRSVTNIVTKNWFWCSYNFCFYKFIVTDIDLDSCWVFEPVVTPPLFTLAEHIFPRFSWYISGVLECEWFIATVCCYV